MGASGKWIRTLVGLKSTAEKERPGAGVKVRKWSRLWRSSSSQKGGAGSASVSEAPSEASSTADALSLSSVVAAVVRAPPRDFRLIRQEWAAVRIQTAFRAFLARRALRALRGIVRLQALVRGRRVRQQLAVTVKCMNALVRAQERARDRRSRISADGRDAHDVLDERSYRADPVKEAEAGWCDSQGTVDDLRSKIHMRHEGAVKRDRAIAYALSHQRSSSHSGRPSSPAVSLRNHGTNRSDHNWSYLEGWMTTKPWENRLMEQTNTEHSTNSGCSGSIEEMNAAISKLSVASSVKIRRNNVTTRVAARPPSTISASSDFVCDASSPSTSSVTPVSGTNLLTSERRFDCGQGSGPNYMSWTKSAKARLNGSSSHKPPLQRQRSSDLHHNSRMALSSVDVQSTAGSEVSVTSKRLNSLTLKGRSTRRSLDKENDGQPVALF
ncbi:protein IQ-DOMAIN 6-like [Phragmites australis]|uniref:protein IQ-DOMAIN 6-like n=1 Tax=Phragmites australis TaxID=29695 RepID=UPI002D79BACF|nr:protein IQ-DOMAIN 6-like [Phragmites australis]